MRVWIGVGSEQLSLLSDSGALTATEGLAVTPGFQQASGEDELEVLEDQVRDLCATPVVLVAELAAQELSGDTGHVTVSEPVTLRNLRAVFVRPPGDEEYSWFGPTELLSAVEFLG